MNLNKLIEKNGVDKCLFLIKMKTYKTFLGLIKYIDEDSPEYIIPTIINEETYKIKDNYKITLESIYPNFGKKTFYICDLELLIDEGDVVVYTKHVL